jgi:hypothetical protein
MTPVDRLIEQLRCRGIEVVAGDKPDQLKLVGNTKAIDAGTLAGLQLFKADLLARVARSTQDRGGRSPAGTGRARVAKRTRSAPQPESDRAHLIHTILTRAIADKRRRVFGFTSQKASCAEVLRGAVPDEWDRLCVEGDAEWTQIPLAVK